MYKQILHATDLFENHFDMCKQALNIAKCFGAQLHLLHVIEPPVSLQLAQGLGFAEVAAPAKDGAMAVMATLGEALNIPEAQQHVKVGSISTHVLQKAKELNCTLIIIGQHMHSKIPAFLESSAHEIVPHARCDVLILQA